MSRLRKRFMDCKGLTLEEAESFATGLAEQQRDVLFQIGDLYRHCESRWPDTHFQIWPEWISPGMLARTAGVAKAYPTEESRECEATYTIYMREANSPDRINRVAAHVEAGRTSDEAGKASHDERAKSTRPRWMVLFDMHYFVHRWFFSGVGVETASQVSQWVRRTMERLKEKGATDCLCAFDDEGSFRRQLTEGEGWEDHRYKGNRGPKPEDLKHQIHLTRTLLEGLGFCCHSVPDYEADDVLASVAKQFPGKVTIISSDKDLRQCLSDRCNILLDVEWTEDESTGEAQPDYKWLTAKMHAETTGIRPDQWAEYQSLMGDNVDSIQGCEGIGAKGSADLIQQFGSIDAAIAAAKDGDDSITPRKRESLIEFEGRLAITRQLVTLVDTLTIPSTTRL